jgi:hypothetical protein
MKQFIRFSIITILFFTSVSALFGGGALLLSPNGDFLQMSPKLLSGSPFKDFFIPGLALFIMLGLSSLIIASIALALRRNFPLLIIYQGIVVIIFLVVEIVSIKTFDALQVVYALDGLALLLLGVVARAEKME